MSWFYQLLGSEYQPRRICQMLPLSSSDPSFETRGLQVGGTCYELE